MALIASRRSGGRLAMYSSGVLAVLLAMAPLLLRAGPPTVAATGRARSGGLATGPEGAPRRVGVEAASHQVHADPFHCLPVFRDGAPAEMAIQCGQRPLLLRCGQTVVIQRRL